MSDIFDKIKIMVEPSPVALALKAATLFSETISTLDQPAFSVALSGGSTPQSLFQILAASPFKNDIPWRQVHFFWGDERCVAPDDADSNFGMTKAHLLDHIDISESNIHRILGENDPAQEARRYAAALEAHLPRRSSGVPMFDLIFLGMGSDGHTASLFPGTAQLAEQETFCTVSTHPENGQQRISLTLPVINAAREVIFLVSGAGKQVRVKEILGRHKGYRQYPAARVQPEDGHLVWLLDRDAAELLQK